MDIFKKAMATVGGGGNASVLVLTPLGKQKADGYDLPGNKWRVLSQMQELGPSTVKDIADETNMPEAKVREICKSLIRQGYIKKSSAD